MFCVFSIIKRFFLIFKCLFFINFSLKVSHNCFLSMYHPLLHSFWLSKTMIFPKTLWNSWLFLVQSRVQDSSKLFITSPAILKHIAIRLMIIFYVNKISRVDILKAWFLIKCHKYSVFQFLFCKFFITFLYFLSISKLSNSEVAITIN